MKLTKLYFFIGCQQQVNVFLYPTFFLRKLLNFIRHDIFLSLGLLVMNQILMYCSVRRITYVLPWCFCTFYRFAPGSDGSSSVCLHTFRHGMAEGLLEAAGEHSTAMDGVCAHRAGTGHQWVRWLKLQSQIF